MMMCRSAVGAWILFITSLYLLHTNFFPLSHTLNMPKQCRRDEAHIRNFGHHQKKHLQIMKTKKMQAKQPQKNRITLMDCYLLFIYMPCDFFVLIIIQIASVESKQAKQSTRVTEMSHHVMLVGSA